jgi:exonuclease-1
MNRARLLKRAKVRAIYVFDGGRLPGKAQEEETRGRGRSEALIKARQHAAVGNVNAANDCYVRAVDITPDVARDVIEALWREGFECMTAPYEADAQMAYLVRNGFVSGVITEDSDLIAHGCQSVFTKMGSDGSGIEIRYDDLGKNRGMSFIGFTPEMFLEMCILSGCDYLPSVSGVGLKKAHSLIRRFKTYTKVLRHMKFEGISIPKGYEAGFEDALLTFKYSWVYCPRRRRNVHLNDPSGVLDVAAIEELPRLVGAYHVPEVARGVADCVLHPMTLQRFAKAYVESRPHSHNLTSSAPVSTPLDKVMKNENMPQSSGVRSSSTVVKHDAFVSFLSNKPEDDPHQYRVQVRRAQHSPRKTKPANVTKSFYSTLKAHESTPPPKRQNRRESGDLFRVPETSEKQALVVPDSMQKTTPIRSPRQLSRTPKDISNVAARLIAETPVAANTTKSPYFASSVPSVPKQLSISESYAQIAKGTMERIKKNAEAEFEQFGHQQCPLDPIPIRSTPARAAKKPRMTPSTSNSRLDLNKSKSKSDKFWQTSLFDAFSFGK